MEHEVPVLLAGGGPAGLIAALQLARHGVKCMLAERNLDTTKWPKMDITNCRSMELFNRLGIAQGLREQGMSGRSPRSSIIGGSQTVCLTLGSRCHTGLFF